MTVSVIIPNYNHAPFLEQRIETVLQQTYTDFEIIILDDCSTDNSREIMERYRTHPKVSLIVHNEINSGSTFKQWSKGISLAKGEYIWIAESDDWCEDTFLEVLVPGLNNNKNCVFAFCQSYYINERGDISFLSRFDQPASYTEGKIFLKNKMLARNSVYNASMAVFRKEFFWKAFMGIEEFKYAGDWLFWVRLCCYGDVFISGKFLNYYRNHSRNVTGKIHSAGNNFIEDLKVLKSFVIDNIASRQDIELSLHLKYNRYLLKKGRISKEMRKKIESGFSAFFPNRVYFWRFHFKKSLQVYFSKIKK